MNRVKKCWRWVGSLCGGGLVLAGSCSAAQVSAIMEGIEVAAQGLEEADNDDISFTDWLESELD